MGYFNRIFIPSSIGSLFLLFYTFLKISLFSRSWKFTIIIIRIITITPPIYFIIFAFPSSSYPLLSSFVRSHTMLYYNSVFSSPLSLCLSPPFFSKFLHSHEHASHLISTPIILQYKSCGVIPQVINKYYNRV